MIHIFKDVLPEEEAEELLDKINNLSDESLKTAYYLLEDGPIYIGNSISSKVAKLNNDPLLVDSLRRNLFTYRFKRTVTSDSIPFFEEFQKEKLENFFKSFIEHKLNYNNLKKQETFISEYRQGDFISVHQDGGMGDLAFIFNLTKNWRPEYGGLLHMEQKDGTYVSVNPEFNSLVIMELPEGGANHFVSEVTKYAPNSRIAISGWYTENKENTYYEPYVQ